MSSDLPKTYDPASVEAQAYEVWLREGAFHAEPSESGAPYCIVIPPPNVTGALHLGHAINNTLQDILIRMHRMMGDNTLWIPGIDHAGIATQAVVEKQLKEQENKTRHDIGREALVERIWKWKQQFGDRIIEQLKRMGCSCDWERTRFTLDEQCARAVRETFFKLFKDGLIYRGKRLVNWDVHLQTSISDDEIYHETVKTSLWHIRYPIVDGGSRGTGVPPVHGASEVRQTTEADPSRLTHGRDARVTGKRPECMVVATTRPETMLGDTAVAVHPDDPRWNWAIGKSVRLPLTNRFIPIIADPILVNMEFGSGCVKVTPAHDPNDYAVWQRQNGEIDIINILTPDGRINDDLRIPEKYRGLTRDAARKKVVEDLTHAGRLEKEEPYETQVGHSDRSKTPIEPYLSDQWFVKMAPLAEPALEVVRQGIIKFFPERHAQQYLSWLGEKRDWPISRQLWWGHRIPVWRRSTRLEKLPSPVDMSLMLTRLNTWRDQGKLAYQFLSDVEGITPLEETDKSLALFYVCLHQDTNDPEITDFLAKAGMEQDPDVLDTWFSSALWPHSTLGWPEQTDTLKKWYPTSVLLTGRDIITLWVARMVMTGMYNMGDPRETGVPPVPGVSDGQESTVPLSSSLQHGRDARVTGKRLGIPFHHVAINPTILDGKGERMSKSKGNGVDPVDIIETHGADALRFTLTTMATETQDVRMPVKKMANGKNTSEKFDMGRNFCNKLWNAAKFVLANLESAGRAGSVAAEGGGQCPPYSSDVARASRPCEESKHGRDARATVDSVHPSSFILHPSGVDETKWSMADRWIVSRFNRTVAEVDDALSHYRFDQYAKACYDFFWRDFCDWYVEAAKPVMKDPARAGQTANMLASVLDGALRLMHPMIPFITEIIWWRLNEVRPVRGIPGRLDCPPGPRLIKAAWPKAGEFAEAAEHIFPRLQEIIVAIRNVRNQYKADVKKPVSVSILAPGDSARQINDAKEMIELLATCRIREARADLAAVQNAARTTAAGCEIFVEGLIDADAEKQRLSKRREDLSRQIAALEGRLGNAGYIAKAPPKLVQQTQEQLAEARAELTRIEAEVAKLD